MTALADLIARWGTDEGKPYKRRLIDIEAYHENPDNLGCMCAQGQVLHLIGGWSPERLVDARQVEADAETAKLLKISRAHAALLRIINDRLDGAPATVITDPGAVLGERWSAILDFWHYMDSMSSGDLAAAGDAAWYAGWDAASDDAWESAWAAGRAAAWAATWAAGRAAAAATAEIQGADILRDQGRAFVFLPAFGFADLADIPPRPADYGTVF